MARECPERKEQPFKPSFQANRFTGQQRPSPFKPKFSNFPKKKPFGKTFNQKRPQGFRKFNRPLAFHYVQQARAAHIEEMGEEDEENQEYEQEDISKLAARTSRLSEDEREALLEEMIKANPDF